MPLNNVSIKLDDKYFLPKRDVKSNNHSYYSPDQNYIKVHSYFNNRAGMETERTVTKEKGNQTADREDRFPQFDSFRKTHLVGFSHISEEGIYSTELKQKLEKMHFVRLRIQKSKKIDKVSYVVIKNKSLVKKECSNLGSNDEEFIWYIFIKSLTTSINHYWEIISSMALESLWLSENSGLLIVTTKEFVLFASLVSFIFTWCYSF